MNKQRAYDYVCDCWNDIVSDVYTSWANSNGLDTADDDTYEQFKSSPANEGIRQFLKEMLVDQ